MKALFKLTNAKLNLMLLSSVESLRIALETKNGNKTKVENHQRHQEFLIEIAEVLTDLENENKHLTTRNAELNYSNTRLLHDLDKAKQSNTNLIEGL